VTQRITNRSIATQSVANLQAGLAKRAAAQDQMSSGKLISKPSDDPVGTNNALQYRGDIRTNEQYVRSAENGASWLAVQDQTLQDVSSRVAQLRSLAVQAANTGSMDPSSRGAIAKQVQTIKDQLVGLSNTTYLGRPVFGGVTAGTAAFTQDPTTGKVTYAGDDSAEVTRRVAPGTDVTVSSSGAQVFGADGSNLFDTVDSFLTALGSGSSTALNASVGAFDTAGRQVTAGLATVGARANQVDGYSTLADARLDDLKSSLSTVEDIDYAESSIDYNLQNVAYQASLAVTAKVIQPTLVDFLR